MTYYPYGQPNYGNYGYQPNYQPVINQAVQPQTQQIMQQSQQQIQNIPIREVRFVTSDEAKAYIVFPNSNALLIDIPNGIAHFKSADNLGQSYTEYFRFEKVNADGTPVKKQEAKADPKFDTSMFVSKDDFATLAEKVDSLQKRLSKSIQQPIKDENEDK